MFSSGSVFAQSDLISAPESNVIPLTTLKPEDAFADLKPLATILKGRRVVALGEATHGTKEFSDYKHLLLRYLVTEMGFKTFVIEADFVGTQTMNDYVLYGKGTVSNALKKMGMGVWSTQEFVNMVEWIKGFNQSKVLADKIKFYGCDMQFALNSAAALKNGTIKLTNDLSPEAIKGLDVIGAWAYTKVNKEDLVSMRSLAKELARTSVIESDQVKLEAHKQILRTIIQTVEYAEAPYLYSRNIIRDRCMAENSEWIYNYESKNKMIVWAHNLHIARYPTKEKNPPMGFHLKERFQNDYFAIGFGFNSGKLSGWSNEHRKLVVYNIPEVKVAKSSDYIFSQVSYSNFIMDFKSASSNQLIAEFIYQLNSRSIGGRYDEEKQAAGANGTYQNLVKLYDAIIFIRNTNASTPYMSH